MNKIGRNDPCPCGSGKKYKHCCRIKSEHPSSNSRASKYVELNKEIAYKGAIGRIREEFCIRYTNYKLKMIAEIEKYLINKTSEQGEIITCHKGCFFCCSQYIVALLQEIEVIVYFLYHHEAIMHNYLIAYPRWRAEVKKNETLFQNIGKAYNEMAGSGFSSEKQSNFMTLSDQYLKLNILCPFLNNDICSIYEVRPTACASVVATTPGEACSPANTQKCKVYIAPTKVTKEMVDYYLNIGSYIYVPAPVGVYELIQNGYPWLSDVSGLKGLDENAMTDPEVKPILAKYL